MSTLIIGGSGSYLGQGYLGGAVYTITADTGSVSITGVSITLKAPLRAATGVIIIAGVAANLKNTRVLAATVGNVVLAGNAASLLSGRKIFGVVGSILIDKYIIYDDFNRADGTSLGSNWTDLGTNSAAISSNKITGNNSGNWQGQYYNAAQAGSANYDVVGTISTATSTSQTSLGLGGRIDSATGHGYYIFWNASGYWDLSRYDGGLNPTNIGQGSALQLDPSTPRTVILRLRGSTISVIVDGTTVITVSNETTYSAKGYAGIQNWYAAGPGFSSLDDFYVYDAIEANLSRNKGILANTGSIIISDTLGAAPQLIEFNHKYPGTSNTFANTANVGDMIIIAAGHDNTNNVTATVSGATATLSERLFRFNGSGPASITFLSGPVTVAGVPTITLNSVALGDMGYSAWVVRNLPNSTPHVANSEINAGTSYINVAATTTKTASIFAYWLNEATGHQDFVSFTSNVDLDLFDTGHYDASGHKFGLSTGSYVEGANVTGSAGAPHNDNVIGTVYFEQIIGGTQLIKGGSGQRTLTAATGTITVTGVAANLLFGHKLLAATGTIIVTGVAANLLFGHKLLSSAGSIVITGISATLTYSGSGPKTLTATAGTIVITRNAANLLWAHKLTASSGTITITGIAANLLYGRKVLASTGSITITRNANILIVRSVKTMVPKLWIIAPSYDNLLWSLYPAGNKPRVLTATSGLIIVTGVAATLKAPYKLIASAKAFSITMHDANLNKTSSFEFVDNLTGTAGNSLTTHTSDSGHTWSTIGDGTQDIVFETGGTSIKASGTPDTLHMFLPSITPASKNQTVNASITINNTGKNTHGLISRCTDKDNLYFVQYGGGVWDLQQRVAGTITSLSTWTDPGTAPFTRIVELVVTDAAKIVNIDGVQRINYTATNALTSVGKYGILAWYTDTTGYSTMDYIKASS